jgi:hypothetical protein
MTVSVWSSEGQTIWESSTRTWKLTRCTPCDESSASADGSNPVNLIGHGEPPAKTGFRRSLVQAVGHTEWCNQLVPLKCTRSTYISLAHSASSNSGCVNRSPMPSFARSSSSTTKDFKCFSILLLRRKLGPTSTETREEY